MKTTKLLMRWDTVRLGAPVIEFNKNQKLPMQSYN